MSAETKSSLATRPSLLARLKDWSQQTAWREEHEAQLEVGAALESAFGKLTEAQVRVQARFAKASCTR